MTAFKIKQLLLALCLMTSLLIGSSSACACSHHQVVKKQVHEDCHTHHDGGEQTETADTGGTCIDVSCICSVNPRSPFAAVKSETNDIRPDKQAANAEQAIARFEFVAVTASPARSPEFANDLSHSTTLRSLLRARAPPRL